MTGTRDEGVVGDPLATLSSEPSPSNRPPMAEVSSVTSHIFSHSSRPSGFDQKPKLLPFLNCPAAAFFSSTMTLSNWSIASLSARRD